MERNQELSRFLSAGLANAAGSIKLRSTGLYQLQDNFLRGLGGTSFWRCCIAHMFGLRGLFVWKQKAITDAPDTLFNCNTKSQAKKNHRAMVVSSTAYNTTFWS